MGYVILETIHDFHAEEDLLMGATIFHKAFGVGNIHLTTQFGTTKRQKEKDLGGVVTLLCACVCLIGQGQWF